MPYVWEKQGTAFLHGDVNLVMTNTCSVYLTPPAITTLGLMFEWKYTGWCVPPYLHTCCTSLPELPSTATSTCYYLRTIMVTSYFENKFTMMNYIREHFTRKECCVCECCEVHTNTQTHTCSQARIHTHTHTHTHIHTRTHTRVFKSHGH